jgi:hypothetical protein
VLPKSQELLVYDISRARETGGREKPTMIQAVVLSTTPFAMYVIRNHKVPGVPEK